MGCGVNLNPPKLYCGTSCDATGLALSSGVNTCSSPYILDLYCIKAKLAIEVDGSQHALPDNVEYDEARTAFLNGAGIRVLRFSNSEALLNTDAVLARIYEALDVNTQR